MGRREGEGVGAKRDFDGLMVASMQCLSYIQSFPKNSSEIAQCTCARWKIPVKIYLEANT